MCIVHAVPIIILCPYSTVGAVIGTRDIFAYFIRHCIILSSRAEQKRGKSYRPHAGTLNILYYIIYIFR
jgi:hypothetical protein